MDGNFEDQVRKYLKDGLNIDLKKVGSGATRPSRFQKLLVSAASDLQK